MVYPLFPHGVRPQESRENAGGAGEEIAGARSPPSARRGRGVGGQRGGGKAKGRNSPGRKRGRAKEQEETESYGKDTEELEEGTEEQEQEDAVEYLELNKR